MRTYTVILLALALVTPASTALSEVGNLSAAFDGGSRKSSLNTRHLRLEAIGPVSNKEGQVPDDIKEASKTWGNDAQFDKLRGAHPEAKEAFSFAVLGDIEPGRFPWQRVFKTDGTELPVKTP